MAFVGPAVTSNLPMGRIDRLLRHPLRLFRGSSAFRGTDKHRLVPIPASGGAAELPRFDDFDGALDAMGDLLCRATPLFRVDLPDFPWQLCCIHRDVDRVLCDVTRVARAAHLRLQLEIDGRRFHLGGPDGTVAATAVRRSREFVLTLLTGPHTGLSLRVCIWKQNLERRRLTLRPDSPYLKRLSFEDFERLFDASSSTLRLRELFPAPLSDLPSFDVDLVYTWVDHNDPEWRKLLFAQRPEVAVQWERYLSADELRYSLRSVAAFAPWARRIFVVTNCKRPAWLRSDQDRIELVAHQQVFPADLDCLPTFNSHAIEACLAHVPGLAEHFVYFNDDMFLGRPTPKSTFFTGNGCSVARLEPHGMVFGLGPSISNPDYLNAAINGQRCLARCFGSAPTRLHHHVPYALKKSVLLEMEKRWADQFTMVRCSRFRSPSDLSIVSFLYHHYALLNRQAMPGSAETTLVRCDNFPRELPRLSRQRWAQFFCLNDGENSAEHQGFQKAKVAFLKKYFPLRAPWEDPNVPER